MIKILQNENDVFWLINGQVKSNLNLNSTLQDLADFLVYEYNIERSNYSKLEFLFLDTMYDDYDLQLFDIGISNDFIIDVKINIFHTFPMRPCTLHDRDHYQIHLDGIRFELSLRDKMEFIIERILANTNKTGMSYIEILNYKLNRTENLFEVKAIQEIIDKIQNLTESYLSQIKLSFEKIFLL